MAVTYYEGTDLEFTETGRWVVKCRYPGCKNVWVGTPEDLKIRAGGCHGSMQWKQIIATPGRKRECGGACTAAKGPSCDCKCRGANHGSGR